MITPCMDPLISFSHVHCIALCAGLVTLITVVSLLRLCAVMRILPWNRHYVMGVLTGILGIGGGLLLLHVLSWWVVGVVMLPTFVLPGVVGLYWGFAWGCDHARYVLFSQSRHPVEVNAFQHTPLG